MRRPSLVTVLALLLTGVVALFAFGCAGGGSTTGTGSGSATTGTSPPGLTILEQNSTFNPPTVAATVGDTITFVNNDAVAHNVKIDGAELGDQNQGESRTWKATKTGDYPYSCVNHPAMTGVIHVN
jgi:plastocyanin